MVKSASSPLNPIHRGQIGFVVLESTSVGLGRTHLPPQLGWRVEWTIVVVEVEWSLCLLDVVIVVVAILAMPRCH